MRDERSISFWLMRAIAALAAVASVAGGCSSDDDGGTPSRPSGGSAGTGGVAASGGTGDASAGVGGSIAGTGGGGGSSATGGAADASTGGAAGTDAAPTGGTGGAAVDSGSDASSGGCGGRSKVCDGDCVSVDDPAFGCSTSECGAACSIPNAAARCFGGSCLLGSCNSGFADCNGNAQDGCETVLASDATHCGACGGTCWLPNATAGCVASACTVASCLQGFQDCNGNAADGCETNVAHDPKNCNACGRVCTATSGAQPFCNNGVCSEKSCAIGLMDCDESVAGCETNLGTDANNCSYCGNRCVLPNATGTCVNGICTPGSCTGGFLDCDGVASNGCETDPATSSRHCGACNRACVTTGTSSVRCDAGRCYAVCDSRGDCTHPASPTADNGCETDVLADPANCAICGFVCTVPSGTPACSGGRCTIADCAANTGDCDGNVANGCETNLLIHPDNCGGCGRFCSTTDVDVRMCSGGKCSSTCETGRANCNQPAAPLPDDGCEAAQVDDVRNCGGCGRACVSTNVLSVACKNGQCTSTCQLGYANCIFPVAPNADDGCELDATTLSNNCGGCGNDCTRQGGAGSGLKCDANMLCGCAGNNARCNLSGAAGTCDAASGRCVCGGTTCHAGEACRHVGSADECSCNGGAACTVAGQVCCQTPAGCADLQTDSASCGACGRACPTGFTCSSAACLCAASGSCSAGSTGSCDSASGRCQCGTTLCQPGQRCVAGGVCG